MVYRLIQKGAACGLLVACAPILLILYIVVRTTSPGPFLYRQKRAGKNKKPFWMYKIRTMIHGADRLKSKYHSQNEADGPVFKIRNDPRYTRFGRFISHSALDEIPQLINVIKGDMAFVGPRPLPIAEASRIPPKYKQRFFVLPGMTSSWIVEGAHQLTFKRWMELDCEYALNKTIIMDIRILLGTIKVVLNTLIRG